MIKLHLIWSLLGALCSPLLGIGYDFSGCEHDLELLTKNARQAIDSAVEYKNVKPEFKDEVARRNARLALLNGRLEDEISRLQTMTTLGLDLEPGLLSAMSKPALPDKKKNALFDEAKTKVVSRVAALLNEGVAPVAKGPPDPKIEKIKAEIARLKQKRSEAKERGNKNELSALDKGLRRAELKLVEMSSDPKEVDRFDLESEVLEKARSLLSDWKPARWTPKLLQEVERIQALSVLLTRLRLEALATLSRGVGITRSMGSATREEKLLALSQAIETIVANPRLSEEVTPEEFRGSLAPTLVDEQDLLSKAAHAQEQAEAYANSDWVPNEVKETLRQNLIFFRDFEVKPNPRFISLVRAIARTREHLQ